MAAVASSFSSRCGTPRGSCRAATPRAATPRAATPSGSGTLTPRRGLPSCTPRDASAGASGAPGESSLKAAGLGLLGLPKVPKLRLGGPDVAPGVQPAGKLGGPATGPLILPTPRTPEGLGDLRLRHRQRTGPGETSVHWGLKDVPFPGPGAGYGHQHEKGDDVAQVFKAGQRVGVAEYRNSVGEAIYQGTIREPLGKSWVRGHGLPQETQVPNFLGFGLARPADMPAKEAIFPRNVQPESERDQTLYRKTHGSWGAGEMSSRDYDWPKAVEGSRLHRYGREDIKDSNNRGLGVKTALTMDCGSEPHSLPGTTVISVDLAHYQQVTKDHMGIPFNLKQNRRQLPEGHTHGMSSGSDNTGAGELIRGFYSTQEQKPDEDLGRCTARGRRNFLSGTPMGVPTIRSDLLAPPAHRRSVACAVNYGDDDDARCLIAPGKFQLKGVFDQDFWVRRPPEELRGILIGIKGEVAEEDFRQIFEHAVELHGNDDTSTASLEAVMVAYADWAIEQERFNGTSM